MVQDWVTTVFSRGRYSTFFIYGGILLVVLFLSFISPFSAQAAIDHSADFTNHSGDITNHSADFTNHSGDIYFPGYWDHLADFTDHSGDFWVSGYTDHSADFTDHSGDTIDHSADFIDHSGDITLFVSTSASPSLGEVPLNNVAVTASVSGTATGSIVYKLDCTNDGSFEATTGSISSTSYAFSTKCNYSSSGSYTIKVKAERQGISDTGIKSISVSNPPPSSVTIEASPSGTVTNGTSVTYTATANSTVSNTSPTYWIDIFQDGIFKTGCSSGTQCSYITSGTNVTRTFTAKIEKVDFDGVIDTDSVSTTWTKIATQLPGADFSFNPATFPTGQSTTVEGRLEDMSGNGIEGKTVGLQCWDGDVWPQVASGSTVGGNLSFSWTPTSDWLGNVSCRLNFAEDSSYLSSTSNLKNITINPPCSGSISLSLTPNPVTEGTTMTLTASGLSNCQGNTIDLIEFINPIVVPKTGTFSLGDNHLSIANCLVDTTGANVGKGCSLNRTAPAFSTVTNAPNLTYYRVHINKNEDGDALDAGEGSNIVAVQILSTDTNSPTIDINVDSDKWERRNNLFNINVDFSDNIGLSSVEYRVGSTGAWNTPTTDGSSLISLSGSSYTTEWRITSDDWDSMDQGDNIIYVRARDTSGNDVGYDDPVFFTIKKDDLAPSSTIKFTQVSPSLTLKADDNTYWLKANTYNIAIEDKENITPGVGKYSGLDTASCSYIVRDIGINNNIRADGPRTCDTNQSFSLKIGNHNVDSTVDCSTEGTLGWFGCYIQTVTVDKAGNSSTRYHFIKIDRTAPQAQ